VRQLHSAWSDGPAYITQCPIQSGQSYVYNFSLVGQRGTLFWHAHHSWLRATLYGPLIILPRTNESYPFAKPYKEIPILFGITSTHACIYNNQTFQFFTTYSVILYIHISCKIMFSRNNWVQESGGMWIRKLWLHKLFTQGVVQMSLMPTPLTDFLGPSTIAPVTVHYTAFIIQT